MTSNNQPDALLLLGLELHDGPIQSLTAALMFLEAAVASDHERTAASPNQQPTNQHRGIQLVRDAVIELRSLLSDIHEQSAGSIAAPDLVQRCCDSLATSLDLQVHCHIDEQLGLVNLTSGQAWHLTRVLGESLRNVARHSGQREANVDLQSESGMLLLSISDHGAGFDPQQVPSGHFGLKGIQSRAALLDGEVSVTSGLGIGTSISVSIPIS